MPKGRRRLPAALRGAKERKIMRKLILAVLIISLMTIAPFSAAGAQEKKVFRVVGDIPTLLTPGNMNGVGIQMHGAVYEWLVSLAPDKVELKPELAQSWTWSDDYKVWTLELKPGVTWHNGASLTPEDVIFTIERTQDPALGHKSKKTFEVVEKVEKAGDLTVKITLKESRPRFMATLTDYNMPVLLHTYDYSKLGETAPMGTGPFTVKGIVPKENVVLVKNPDYHIAGAPKLDEIHFIWISDIGTRANMLLSGEADMCREMAPTDAQRARNSPGTKVAVPYTGRRILAMRVDQKPFNDNRIRQALKYCFNNAQVARIARAELDQTIFMTESPLGPMYPEYLDLPHRGPDLEKAKELLKEAGVGRVKLELFYEANLDHGEFIALSLQESAKEAGFDIELRGVPREVYYDQAWLKANFTLTGWSPRVDPTLEFYQAYRTGAPWNETHLADARFDDLIDKISAEGDPVQAKVLFDELQRLFYDEGGIYVVHVPRYTGLSKNVTGYNETITLVGDWREIDFQ